MPADDGFAIGQHRNLRIIPGFERFIAVDIDQMQLDVQIAGDGLEFRQHLLAQMAVLAVIERQAKQGLDGQSIRSGRKTGLPSR